MLFPEQRYNDPMKILSRLKDDAPACRRPTRILLFTGKGGVGKTSLAAATALRAAQLGHGALIMSTDAAHSLSDSYDLPIGSEPTQLAERLWGQEIDVNNEIAKTWGAIHEFLMTFMKSRGFESIIADELAILPGMEELFSLLEVKTHVENPKYDVIVIDCAPTADTARLLALPEIARWYMEKLFKIERFIVKTVRPVAQKVLDIPLPHDAVFDNIEKLYHRLQVVKDLLTDRNRTSIRMVVNPEKMVIKEAQRAYTFLSLFDFGIDAVVVNRLLPPEIQDPYYGKWREIQADHLRLIHESFEPLPILTSRLWDQEVVGLDLLGQLAREVYGDRDPVDVMHQEQPVRIVAQNGFYVLELPAPFAAREELETWISGDELVIRYKKFQTQPVPAPDAEKSQAVPGRFQRPHATSDIRRSIMIQCKQEMNVCPMCKAINKVKQSETYQHLSSARREFFLAAASLLNAGLETVSKLKPSCGCDQPKAQKIEIN